MCVFDSYNNNSCEESYYSGPSGKCQDYNLNEQNAKLFISGTVSRRLHCRLARWQKVHLKIISFTSNRISNVSQFKVSLKCPACNTKEKFNEEMERCGILFPDTLFLLIFHVPKNIFGIFHVSLNILS